MDEPENQKAGVRIDFLSFAKYHAVMARKKRIHFSGALYHVILRGNAGERIFFKRQDHSRFLLFLQSAVERFQCRVHAFCLMKNHIHLVMQVGEAPLAIIMQNISLRFTKWINYSQFRTGHVFQGRYKALLVDADGYLVELVRYVHLNPVRAGLATSPEEYPWSGHRAYLGREHLPWLTTDLVLRMLSAGRDTARAAYEAFVCSGVGEERRSEFNSGTSEGRILGSQTFADTILGRSSGNGERTYTLEEVVTAVCDHFRISVERLKAPGKARPMATARGVAAAIVQKSPHLQLTELGKLLDREVSVLGKAARHAATEDQSSSLIREVVAVLCKK